MSQFILLIGDKSFFMNQKNIEIVDYDNFDPFLKDKAKHLIGEKKKYYKSWTIVDSFKRTTDNLLLDSKSAIIKDNINFKDTILYNILHIATSNMCDVFLWYSSYIEDLPVFKSKDDFLKSVNTQLMEDMMEIYAIFSANQP